MSSTNYVLLTDFTNNLVLSCEIHIVRSVIIILDRGVILNQILSTFASNACYKRTLVIVINFTIK